ncbi:MAG: helix-turn-helix domain-containing protein [Clostridium sp.]|nr:helix-turn-helix domain-containing protein [Clostridium sp.]
MNPNMIYHPLTATPFKRNVTYQEIEPCQALQPYIRCFWGAEAHCHEKGAGDTAEIVIPDTCADIIYYIDYTDNTIAAGFCGVNDRSFYAGNDHKAGHEVATFAIRFYAWSAYVFSEDSFMGTVNGYYDVGERFGWLDKELQKRLLEPTSLADKIRYAEKLLVKKLETARNNKIVDSAAANILLHHGSLEISWLSKASPVSSRQLERLFHEYIGITPKKLSNLVRYQFLWKDVVSRTDFDILNAVYEYRYTDTAHLMREFKRYHSMGIREAKQLALQNK